MNALVPTAARRLLACVALAAVSLLLLASASASAAVLDLEKLDGPTAIEMMESGELTSVELTQAYIDRINALNQAGPGINAVSQLNKEALKEAQKYDEMRAKGEVLSPAMGLPILLKDLIDVKGMYTSAGNWSLRDSYPATDSGIAKKLRESGVVILGKLGLSEYANYFGRQPSGFGNLTGQVLHGFDADQNPSGSSSGSGSAGAAALSMLTIGTETSGSILSPSRANSLVGLRPTVGLVAGYGIAPIVASQDTAGPMDRTVANAALTLQSIAGPDPINDAYYEQYWAGVGLEPSDVVPPAPATVPDYLSALDPNFVKGKRIGWNGSSTQILEAKQALEDAGAILVERPVINTGSGPSLSWYPEMHMAIDRYYERLGPDAPINSLAEEVADNEAESHFALKFGNVNHDNANNATWGPGATESRLVEENLPLRKAAAWEGIDRMMANDTPGDPGDDFIAILGSTSQGALAGYPALTIPMGYNETQRRTISVDIHGGAYDERDLLGVAYVIEQGTLKRQPASQLNPSMYRCAETVPAPAYVERGDCNPNYETALAAAGGSVPELDFPLETTSAAELQEMMEAGELTATELTRAYLARIAAANAAGPAIQAVREINPAAVTQAEALDAERAGSGPRGPLHGIPVLLNDGIDAKGLPSTGGSIALQGAMPASDSRIASKLKGAGAIILGTANVTELNGMFSGTMPDGYSSLGGQVLMPSDTDDVPAGSSAGAAAAVASGMAAMAVGMESSGDPAALVGPAGVNGVVGLKPTVGRVSRSGVMPVARSHDSPGPLAQTVTDVAAQLQVISGPDFKDTASTEAPAAPDYLAALDEAALSGKTLAVVDNTGESANTKVVYDTALKTVVEDLGASTEVSAEPEPDLPDIATLELGRDLDAYLSGLSGGFAGSLEEIVSYNSANPVEGLKYQQGKLVDATAVDLSETSQSEGYEADLEASLEASTAAIDGILDAGTPGDPSDDRDLIMVPYNSDLVEVADQAGYPVLSVLGGYGVEQMGRNPVGVTFIAGPFEEAELLAAGYAFETASTERQAPSWTNPSMWRCVELSEFYSPVYCRPGTVDALAVEPPVVPPTPPTTTPPPVAVDPAPTKAKVVLKQVKRIKSAGTAFIRVQVSGKGYLVAKSKAVRKVVRRPQAPKSLWLPVRAKGKALATLKENGKVKVTFKVTFIPAGGEKAVTTRSLTLVKR